MTDLAAKYKIPAEIMAFVNDGFLVVLSEDESTKTVEFHIPTQARIDRKGRFESYSVFWIHPDFNAQFCRYYDNTPGDMPNFDAVVEITDVGSEPVEGLDTVDDLEYWLSELADQASEPTNI